MGMFTNKDSYLDECRAFCAQRKLLAESWDWQPKPTKSNELVATSSILDENQVSIRGLTLFGRYHLGTDTGFEYIHLGVTLSSGFRSRICGLDVHPDFDRSHFDSLHKNIYGPHFHVGDHKKVSIHQHSVVTMVNDLGIENLPRWVEIFKEKARVVAHNRKDIVAPPMERDLLGQIL
jgi:hypothetical protein